MMTASVALLALVPMIFSTGPGSEVTRPLAVVVISGLLSSTALTLLVLPVLYPYFEDKTVEA
jgi:cobalt-zinc-cadmium resistance protein CzcA